MASKCMRGSSIRPRAEIGVGGYRITVGTLSGSVKHQRGATLINTVNKVRRTARCSISYADDGKLSCRWKPSDELAPREAGDASDPMRLNDDRKQQRS